MSTHPNVLLVLALTPDGLSRKTMRDILSDLVVDAFDDVTIGAHQYHHLIMESDYDEGFQVAANEGDLVFLDMVTYGYGETVAWDELEAQKNELAEWAEQICQVHHCSWRVYVTANYW